LAFAEKAYTGDGSTTDFTITFDYLDEDHVKVSVDGTPTSDGGSLYEFVFVNSTTVRITAVSGGAAPTNGAAILVYRETPIDTPAVVWSAGASLTSDDLNKLAEYYTYSLQEIADDVAALS